MGNKQQLWALYLGNLSFLGNELDRKALKKHKKIWELINDEEYKLPERLIYGVPEVEFNDMMSSYRRRINNFAMKKHGIKGKNDILSEVHRLIEGSDLTKEVSREIQRIKLMPNSYLKEQLEDENDELKAKMYKLILLNLDSLSSLGILAYDLANAISLCRVGGVYGYLTTREVIEKVNSIAKIVHEKYRNYEEFGVASRLGYEIDILKLKHNKSDVEISSDSNVMREVGHSIWTHLPWPESFIVS